MSESSNTARETGAADEARKKQLLALGLQDTVRPCRAPSCQGLQPVPTALTVGVFDCANTIACHCP